MDIWTVDGEAIRLEINARNAIRKAALLPLLNEQKEFEHACMLIRAETRERAQVSDHQLDRVERPMLQRSDARIGPIERIALIAVVCLAAFAELRVLASARTFVESRDGGR